MAESDPPDGPTTSLTRRGWTFTGAAGGLVLGSRILGAGPLAGLGIGAAILIVVALVWVRVRQPELRMMRSVRPARLHVGTEGRVVLDGFTGTKTPLLTLTDRVDDGRRAARFLLPPSEPDAALRALYRIPTRRRGRHVVGPLVGSVTDPFGIARSTFVAADATDIVICPRIHALLPPQRGGGGEPAAHAEGARVPAVEPLGEFLALRDYEPGDDPRRVHWASSARRGELLVRQDEAASPGRVVLLLDARPEVHDDATFEVAVEAVASLAVSMRRVHSPFEAVTTQGEVLGRPGPGAVEILLERLAVVEVGEPDYLLPVIAGLRDRLGIGAVVAATGYLDARLADALALLRPRCLVTAVATGATDTTARAPIPVVDASADLPTAWNAYTSSAARRWNRARSLSS